MDFEKSITPIIQFYKKLRMLIIRNLTYSHPNKNVLFSTLNMTVHPLDKIALIGHNGVGKSTLLQLIAQHKKVDTGQIVSEAEPFYIPQVLGQLNHLTIAEALQVDIKLKALHEILKGNVDETNFSLLNDDWTLEDRCQEALNYWGMGDLCLTQKLSDLSGGQKMKVFLAGILIHQPAFILLDEPTNHLDELGRRLLYNFIQNSKATFIIVTHDRELLQLLQPIYELNRDEVKIYGGNYEYYRAQKKIEQNALSQDIEHRAKTLRKAQEQERKIIERQHKLDIRAKKNLGKAGLPKIVSNTWKNNAERSTAKITGVHSGKIEGIKNELQDLRLSVLDIETMKFEFDSSQLHKGKNLFIAENINFSYNDQEQLWQKPLNFEIVCGERIAITGKNGAGKTTLIQLILGQLEPTEGKLLMAKNRTIYIDQDYSLIDNDLKVYEQAQQFNQTGLLEHEVKIRLNRFLFSKDDWDKPCSVLSGGERMRMMLCCLNIGHQSPDLIILDEPTNNLDIQNIDILTKVINEYTGTLMVISHDQTFLKELNMERIIEL